MGIEPTLEAWEAPVLPLNYAREPMDCRAESQATATVTASSNQDCEAILRGRVTR